MFADILAQKLSSILADYKDISFRGFKIGKLIFYGTPRAGKTTLRKQLLRNTKDMLQMCSTPEPSTPIAEIGSPILIERILAQNGENNEWRWTVKELDDIAKMLLRSLDLELSKHENIQHKLKLPQSNVISQNVSLLPTSNAIIGHLNLGKPHVQQAATTTTATSISEAEKTSNSMQTVETNQVTSTSSDVAEVQKTNSNIDIRQLFLNAVKTGQWSEVLSALHFLNNSMLLQVIDGGGQPTFQEIFPLLISGPSVTLIIFKLTDGLTESKPVRYQPSDGKEHSWQDSYVVKEVIFHALSSVCSFFDGGSPILLVGTHKDKLEGSEDLKMTTIRNIATSLRGWLRESKPYKSMKIKSIEDLIIGINNFQEQDILKVKAEIEKLVSHITCQDIPAPFLVFDFALHSYAKSEHLRKVEKIKCCKIAQLCGIKDDEFEMTLAFLRDNAGTVLYYADIPQLKDYVITDFQLIFDSISKIIIEVNYLDYKESLHKKGQLEASVLKDVEGCLNKDELLSLLQHCHIISKMDENVFFMPSVLSKADPSCNKSCSFLVIFEDGYCPIGLFCAATTRLMVQHKWNVIKTVKQFRNKISFYYKVSKLSYKIIFSSFSTHYEVHLLEDEGETGSNVRSAIFKAFKEVITKVTTDMHYPYPLYGFYCPKECTYNGVTYPQYQHPAKCQFDDTELEMICYYTDKRTRLTEEHKSWFPKVNVCMN